MANSLINVIPQLLAQGLLALREQAIMPRLVNRGYEPTPGEKGSSVDVPIPSAVTANDVAASRTSQNVTDLSPAKVNIPLNQWKEAAFVLTDKETGEVQEGTLPMQASEAIKSLANVVDGYILGKYVGVYGWTGAGGTTPFATDITAYTAARKILADQLAPMSDRRMLLDPSAEANAINIRALQDASYGGGAGVILEGQIGRKLGADWWMDQNIPTHTAGTIVNGAAAKAALVNGALAAGDATMNIDETTLTGTLVTGDAFKFTGTTQSYVVTNTTTLTASSNSIIGVTFAPALAAIVANNVVVTFQDDSTTNMLFHRDAFALATRPLSEGLTGSGLIRAQTDPVSGLSLRLEVKREHKQDRFSYDILYGAALVRAELAARVLG